MVPIIIRLNKKEKEKTAEMYKVPHRRPKNDAIFFTAGIRYPGGFLNEETIRVSLHPYDLLFLPLLFFIRTMTCDFADYFMKGRAGAIRRRLFDFRLLHRKIQSLL